MTLKSSVEVVKESMMKRVVLKDNSEGSVYSSATAKNVIN